MDAPEQGNATRFRRRLVILQAPWNINRKQNVVLLPSEEAVAAIAALPAHCPWDTASHPQYSDALERELADVSRALDEAADQGVHDKVNAVRAALERTETRLLARITRMRGAL
ncbi:MAG: AHH domain-containing protein [Anaeromyxobacter sp.]